MRDCSQISLFQLLQIHRHLRFSTDGSKPRNTDAEAARRGGCGPATYLQDLYLSDGWRECDRTLAPAGSDKKIRRRRSPPEGQGIKVEALRILLPVIADLAICIGAACNSNILSNL